MPSAHLIQKRIGFSFIVCLCGIALGLFLASCATGSCIGATPVPHLSSVSPIVVNSQALPVNLTLKGSGFVSWSTVYLNSVNLGSTMSDSHHLYATITWQNLSAAEVSSGMVYISVTNAGQPMGDVLGCPNGGSSQAIAIVIQ